ncbi:MAG: nucleoside hydrolase [Lachnospiraceae bacterium]|nr:nucleoside hydrolase [Lachnospiraceae bacterium]
MQRILIDADTGIDDSIAILYALKSKKILVEGITTCFGNSGAAQSADNCLRLIQLSGLSREVPVVIGAECSLDGEYASAPAHIHGENGIGNVILSESSQTPLKEDAADFIIRKANELEGDLVIVTTGRLTNLARALEKDPKLPRKVKKLVTMGGCLQVPGNVSPFAEANIAGDARAANQVFCAGFHMVLVGLDVTMKTFITSHDLENLERYCSAESRPCVEYIRKALNFYFEFHRQSEGMMGRCVVHDPLAMLIAEDGTLGEYAMIRACVEYEALAYKGMIVTDHRFNSEMEQDEIAACIRVDSDKAVRRLFSVFQ